MWGKTSFGLKVHTTLGVFPQGIPLGLIIAFLIHKRYIPDPEQLNQQRFKCAAQMREPL